MPHSGSLMTDIILTLLSAALINNVVLQVPLGVDSALQPPSRQRVHMLGLATTTLMLISTLLSDVLYRYLLLPFELSGLRLFVFLPASVLLIRPVLVMLQRLLPNRSFDGLWPLLLCNAGILGLPLLHSETLPNPGLSAVMSLGAGLGFWLALSLFSDLRERINPLAVPAAFRGLPIDLISAGLMALAFFGFNGLFTS